MSNQRASATQFRTALICHAESPLNREGIARWMASFSNLAAIVLIRETNADTRARVRRELKRTGPARFLDVLAFRLYYAMFRSRRDSRWLQRQLADLAGRYPDISAATEVLVTSDPNSPEVEAFLARISPDLIVARCKRLLKERIFTIAKDGTFVLHPGICPEYRNAHGAFWALVNGDPTRVGLTLLRIDRGVDTGPVYAYYTYDFDPHLESHIVIMMRLVLENLDAIRNKLLEIHAGVARPIDTAGRKSGAWGQPWLTKYLRWRLEVRRRRDANVVA